MPRVQAIEFRLFFSFFPPCFPFWWAGTTSHTWEVMLQPGPGDAGQANRRFWGEPWVLEHTSLRLYPIAAPCKSPLMPLPTVPTPNLLCPHRRRGVGRRQRGRFLVPPPRVGSRRSPHPGAEQLGAASVPPPSVPPHPGGPRKAAAAPPPPCAGAVMALPPVLRLCAVLLVVLLPAAAAQQEAVGECQQYTNRSCEECLKNVTCLWCASSRRCVPYPVRRILPPADLCELRSARWGVCWVNFEALIIAMSVVGGSILIMLLVCCCCCCKKKSKKPDKEDERAARERERRRVRQEERRAEMKSRHDEIRRKYGLFKEENPYAKFEN